MENTSSDNRTFEHKSEKETNVKINRPFYVDLLEVFAWLFLSVGIIVSIFFIGNFVMNPGKPMVMYLIYGISLFIGDFFIFSTLMTLAYIAKKSK